MNPAESSWPQQHPENPPPAMPPAFPPGVAVQPGRPAIERKIPLLAGLLSGFPGMGNVYNGLYLRALIQFLIVAGLMSAADRGDTPFFPMTLVFFWAFSVLDAYRQAMLINYGYAQDLGLLDRPQRPAAGQGGLISGVILTLLGLIALADQYVDVDLRWLYDLWPLLLVGVGIWLIVASIRDRKKLESE
ncbi:MAG TPA: DUF5668 domain-containing protein [Thermoanaerobaculia bacterium]|nr:DUF5668 domain-containing protein [Thermoanaerobaculia bacterium]